MKNEDLTFIDFIVRSSWHRISRLYNQKAASHHTTMSVGFILMMIEKEGTPSTKLGPKMGMEPTSLSRTIQHMEENGLIRREFNEKDKRKVFIFLTEDGIALRRIVRDSLVDFNTKCQKKLKKKELEAFFKVMQTIDETVEELEHELIKSK
jgi:MarR family transcriptional regulator, organic hydroperoxide resistance regulator